MSGDQPDIYDAGYGRRFDRATFSRIAGTTGIVMRAPAHWVPSTAERWAMAVMTFDLGDRDLLEEMCIYEVIPLGLRRVIADIIAGRRAPSGKRAAKTNRPMPAWTRVSLIAAESRHAKFADPQGVLAMRLRHHDPDGADALERSRQEHREATAAALAIRADTLRKLVAEFDRLVEAAERP